MDKYDLENELSGLRAIAEDIRMIANKVFDGSLDRDDVHSALHGLATLQELRYDKAFDTFTQVFSLDQYANHDIDIEEECDCDEIGWY